MTEMNREFPPVFDGHEDFITQAKRKEEAWPPRPWHEMGRDLLEESEVGHVDLILRHFEHIVNLVGDEHVSFGTDFDGAAIPEVVKDAAGLPVVLREMKRRGWSDDRIERIANGNFLRVMEAVWKE